MAQAQITRCQKFGNIQYFYGVIDTLHIAVSIIIFGRVSMETRRGLGLLTSTATFVSPACAS